MSAKSISHVALSSFEAYVVNTPTEKLCEKLVSAPTCLADFIEAWVKAGYGVRACNGSFETFMIAVIAIIGLWRVDPGIVDYVTDQRQTGKRQVVERRVESILGEVDVDHNILDRDFFAWQTFRELHGDHPLSP